ncbi:MAG: hypothetical protein KDD22_02275, partial [Bdellovibrionales bacterium]|nr:hypothetical protein [Bdellovibrionales bacterium]
TEKWAEELLGVLAKSKVHAPGSQIAIEVGTKEEVTENHPPLLLLDRRPFGDKTVLYFERPHAEDENRGE